jgi:hypothetical protein
MVEGDSLGLNYVSPNYRFVRFDSKDVPAHTIPGEVIAVPSKHNVTLQLSYHEVFPRLPVSLRITDVPSGRDTLLVVKIPKAR